MNFFYVFIYSSYMYKRNSRSLAFWRTLFVVTTVILPILSMRSVWPWLDFPALVLLSVAVPSADCCPLLFRFPRNVEHFVRVGAVVERPALLVVAPMLVRVSRLKTVHDQLVGTFHDQNNRFARTYIIRRVTGMIEARIPYWWWDIIILNIIEQKTGAWLLLWPLAITL